MSTKPERYAALKDIFLQARAKTASEREAFLEAACAGDAEVRREVEGLLEEDFAASEATVEIPVDRSSVAGTLEHPREIGGYRILGVLGEGGMGVVYEAEQKSPQRTVAPKLMRPGIVSRQLVRRFEHEVHLLGRLQHPGIAQIFEAGTADAGAGVQPYFAMELVRGEPITRYADGRSLDVRA
jgi:serine/threonine protein kinase